MIAIEKALTEARKKFSDINITSANLDAEVLLLAAIDVKDKDKSWLYLNHEQKLTEEEFKKFQNFTERRLKLEPIAYIINRKEFYGINFFVDKNVLIPRVETEIIIEEVLKFLKDKKDNFTFLDIGTGSGCIPISVYKQEKIKHNIGKVYANDISTEAIKVAKKNTRNILPNKKIFFLNEDFKKAILRIGKEKNVILTANLPYIANEDYINLKKNVKDFEPKKALIAPEEGILYIREAIEEFSNFIFKKYLFLIEADPKQINKIKQITTEKISGCKIEILKDLNKKERIVKIYNN